MYVLRFPSRLWPKLQQVFDQQGLTRQVSTDGGYVIAKVDVEQVEMLKLDSVFGRIGPIGGWEKCRDRDKPSTLPSDGRDFS
jgi:hypothetical protein